MKLALAILLAVSTVAVAQTKPALAPQTYSVGDYRLGLDHVVVSSDVHVDNNVPGAVYVNSQTGRVVKISDEEYARLQKLRQAVADEEKKIALAYGVLLVPRLIHAGTNNCLATGLPSCDTDQYQSADRWQFRGQWLLINMPKVRRAL
jgi:hypothetical protein